MINTSKRSKNNSTRDMAWSMAILLFVESFLPGFVQASQHKIYYQLGVKSQFNNEGVQYVRKETNSKMNYAVALREDNLEANGTVSPMLPGGPDQPEVQNFTPIGTSDMVVTDDLVHAVPFGGVYRLVKDVVWDKELFIKLEKVGETQIGRGVSDIPTVNMTGAN